MISNKPPIGRAAWGMVFSLLLAACSARDLPNGGASPPAAPSDTSAETKGLDPRAAFESSGLLGGVSARLESSVTLVPAAGIPEAGPSLALGGALSTAAVARAVGLSNGAKASGHELALASGVYAPLPGPALAMASSGERAVVACVDPQTPAGGSLVCFKTVGEGSSLVAAWKKQGHPAARLLAVPGGRIAVADDASSGAAAKLYLLDVSTGSELWSVQLQAVAVDIAYAPGQILAASGFKLESFDETTGASQWSSALAAKARVLSTGGGVALVIADSGSLSAFSLGDGKGIGAAPGPFDPAIRPVADGPRAIAALPGGGAEELEVKSGRSLRGWSWANPASFLAADRDRIYAGIEGPAGRGVFVAQRAGESGAALIELAAGAFAMPVAVGGARGGLLIFLNDGSLTLVGKGLEPNAAVSPLEARIAPKVETATAIMNAIGRFKPADNIDPRRYLRFDLFSQGMPIDTGVAFTAFRFDAAASGKKTFVAKPASTGTIVATTRKRAARWPPASTSWAGSPPTAYLEKDRQYWVAAGWSYQTEPERFRLFAK